MTSSAFTLPAPIGTLLSLLPAYPGSQLFVAALNLALTRHLPVDTRVLLAQKRLRLRVLDAGLTFDFQWRDGAFRACHRGAETDLMIGATARDFMLLAQRKEDPDTLFFSRRLLMEGDTELGLLVKNTLDAIDLPVFDCRSLRPAQLLARGREALARTGAPPTRRF
jgi:predicted lipid carrier protein YhbT